MIRAIAAIDDRRGIGRHGDIPWNIPDDTAYYRRHTEHSPIIMGRATYDGFKQPLVNRRNLVMSNSLKEVRQGFELLPDAATFLTTATEDVWIIGGAGPYQALLEYCDELYLTHVDGDYDCDRFFPAYAEQFELVSESPLNEQNGHHFRYAIYRRLKNR